MPLILNFAAYLFGPKTITLFFFKKSTIPLTSGSSGPITTEVNFMKSNKF